MRSIMFPLLVWASLAGCTSLAPQAADTRQPPGRGQAAGLISIASPHSVSDTMDRLEKTAKQRDLKVFARIDHAAGAASVGSSLRPTQVLIFGNPQGGTPLMQCTQTIGIDLPLKVLVWQDQVSQVWFSYGDPVLLARRHGVARCAAAEKLQSALAGLALAVVAP